MSWYLVLRNTLIKGKQRKRPANTPTSPAHTDPYRPIRSHFIPPPVYKLRHTALPSLSRPGYAERKILPPSNSSLKMSTVVFEEAFGCKNSNRLRLDSPNTYNTMDTCRERQHSMNISYKRKNQIFWASCLSRYIYI